MIWFALAGILAIVGSVLMLKPSARDSRLARLRMEALKAGLQVRQIIWKPDSPKTGIYDSVNATSYTLVRDNANKAGALKFCIAGQKGWESAHLPEGFSWHKPGTEQEALVFTQALPLLQDALLVLEVWENKVVILVREGPDAKAQAYRQFMASFL